MAEQIKLSNGDDEFSAHLEVWDDLHAERSGFYRAFWTDTQVAAQPTFTDMVPRYLPDALMFTAWDKPRTPRKRFELE